MTNSQAPSLHSLVKSHPHRPLLTHLNADTSWLISFPRFGEQIGKVARNYCHVLIDPWLTGTNIVGSTWFMSFTHAVTPAFTSVQSVRDFIKEVECLAGTTDPTDDGEPDMLCITFFAPDHSNEHTIKEMHKSTPVISTKAGLDRIKSFKHFDESVLRIMPDLSVASPEGLWQDPSLELSYKSELPPWLRIGQLPSDGSYPYLHWATIFAWSPSHSTLGQPKSTAETIIYTPHGIRCERLKDVSWATNPSKGKLICTLHGLAPAWSPMQANLGIANGYPLTQLLKPTYWIPTHDEELEYTGVLGRMQTKIQKTLEDVVGTDTEVTIEEQLKHAGTIVKELANGETFCLA